MCLNITYSIVIVVITLPTDCIMPLKQSNMFDRNFLKFKIFGIWPGKTPTKYYKYYSIIYIVLASVCYIIFVTLNLIYTPRIIELFIRAVIFFFIEITVSSKMLTILFRRDKLLDALRLIDCEEFAGDFESKDGVLYKTQTAFRQFYKYYSLFADMIYFILVISPLFLDLIRGNKPELPISKYYFLTDEVRDTYFYCWFIYQSICIYGHMMYDVNVDMLIAGLLLISIKQLKLLNNNLSNLKLSEEESKMPIKVQETIQMKRLNTHLRHYEVILEYIETIQELLSIALFFQYSVSSLILCLILVGLIVPSSNETRLFLVMFLVPMTTQIFAPAYLGAQLTHESQELMSAAYSSEWIPRSERFKSSLKLFIERVKTPIIISGLKMFSLSLVTFTSIVKTAYSFFTLIRNVQQV